MQRLHNPVRVVEKVADQDDQAAARDAVGHLMQGVGERGLAAGFGPVEFLEDAADLTRAAGRLDELPERGIEGDQTDRILLPDHQVAQAGGEVAGVVEFARLLSGHRRGQGAGVRHGAGAVEHDGGAQIGFLNVLLDVVPVVLAVDAPVEVADVIAGGILTVLGEDDGKPLVG